jgi:glyoxylase-like metal-dependent hydrolase (beta-lactamase superfamily II)
VAAVGDGIRIARGAPPTSALDLAPVAVAALEAHGRLDELADGDEPVPGLRVRTLPGHRPGHAGFEVDARDGRLVHLGDLFHHELHVANPAWHDPFDDDPVLARRTRATLTEEVAARGVLCVAGHLPGAPPGRVVRAGAGHAWSVESVE